MVPLTRKIVLDSSANPVFFDEIKKYKKEKGLTESAGSYFCVKTGAVEMVRLFAREDGACKEYAALNRMLFEEGEETEMKIALPQNREIREKFLRNFNKKKKQKDILLLCLSLCHPISPL